MMPLDFHRRPAGLQRCLMLDSSNVFDKKRVVACSPLCPAYSICTGDTMKASFSTKSTLVAALLVSAVAGLTLAAPPAAPPGRGGGRGAGGRGGRGAAAGP